MASEAAVAYSPGVGSAVDFKGGFERSGTMRFVMCIGMTVGGTIGWWLGDYGGIWTAFLASAVGSFAGVCVVYRLTRDYL
jgi:hypothetical protein